MYQHNHIVHSTKSSYYPLVYDQIADRLINNVVKHAFNTFLYDQIADPLIKNVLKDELNICSNMSADSVSSVNTSENNKLDTLPIKPMSGDSCVKESIK